MKLAVSTLFSLLVAAIPATAATERLKQLLTVPIYTKWTEGTVTILGGEPVDLSTLNQGTRTFREGDFKHVTALYVDTLGSENPFEFDIRKKGAQPSGEYQHCKFWVKEDPDVPGLDILLSGASGHENVTVVGHGEDKVVLDCEWTKE